MADHARLSAIVRGRVQGVGFRYFTRQQALALSVVGWVRNEHDGSVALEAEGPRADLESLLQAIRRGPSAARVSDVDAQWSEAKGTFSQFSVRF